MGRVVRRLCICGMRLWQAEVLKKLVRSVDMSPTTTHLITYSDGCGGQNRNIYLVCLWLHIITIVDQKFMLLGHSYLPNDRDFGNIELAKKRKQLIYIPDDWCALVKEARRKNLFSVCKMMSDDFVSIKSLQSNLVNRKINTHKQLVNWLDIRWIRVTKDQPFQFSYRHSHNALEVWKVVDLSCKAKGRPVDISRVSLPRLYNSPHEINLPIFSLFITVFIRGSNEESHSD